MTLFVLQDKGRGQSGTQREGSWRGAVTASGGTQPARVLLNALSTLPLVSCGAPTGPRQPEARGRGSLGGVHGVSPRQGAGRSVCCFCLTTLSTKSVCTSPSVTLGAPGDSVFLGRCFLKQSLGTNMLNPIRHRGDGRAPPAPTRRAMGLVGGLGTTPSTTAFSPRLLQMGVSVSTGSLRQSERAGGRSLSITAG